MGIHWPDLDEDLGIIRMLKGVAPVIKIEEIVSAISALSLEELTKLRRVVRPLAVA
jgi:hypothetical protein